MCIQLRFHLVDNDAYKHKMAHSLFPEHFSGVLTEERYKHTKYLNEVELHRYWTSVPDVIIKPPAMFSNTKSVASKRLPQSGASKYNNILEK